MSRPPYYSPEARAKNLPEFKGKKQVMKMPAPPASKPPCEIGKYCEFHEYVHGAEAEELRSGLEKLIERSSNVVPRDVISLLQKLLDEVDARDTCDFVQIKPKLGSSGAWRDKSEHPVRKRPKRKTNK